MPEHASPPAPKKRKWHTKDQNGCTRCKARHVKCEQSRPSCRNCVRRGEECHYPGQQVPHRPETERDAPPTPRIPHPEASQADAAFSAFDMELFHRFILTDYPPLPPDSEEAWTKFMPMYAHEYDFLMYAILACSATNSSGEKRPQLHVSALRHRMRALNCIWGHMAVAQSEQTSCRTRDALIGAFYLLVVQSFRLRDGWADFLPLLRGISLVGRASLCHEDDTVWKGIRVQHPLKQRIRDEWKEGRIQRPPSGLLSGVKASVDLLKTECQIEQAVLEVLAASASALDKDDIWGGYEAVQTIWEVLSRSHAGVFLKDCSKPSTRLLIAHWMAIMLLLKPFYDLEIVLGRQGVVAQLPTWIFDIARVSARDMDDNSKALQWPVEVASAYYDPDSAYTPISV